MSWREIGRLARTWLDSERTELLTTDHTRREMATGTRIRTERDLGQAVTDEVGYAVLERALPAGLARRVSASRPENVLARRRAERLERLAGQPTAAVRLMVTGELTGTVDTRGPVAVRRPTDGDERPELTVDLELPAPIPMGSDTFAQLTIMVPHYRGPGRYDLAAMWAQVEAGALDEWEVLETTLRVREESTDLDPCWAPGVGLGLIDVTGTALTFDLAMASAAGRSHVTGSIDWSPLPADRAFPTVPAP